MNKSNEAKSASVQNAPGGDAARSSTRALTTRYSGAWEWALLTISTGLALILAEAACRTLLPQPGFVPLTGSWMPGAVRPNPTRLYELTPGFSGIISESTFGTMHVDINADGLRERPLDELRLADIRVLAVGDSFTFGYGLEQRSSWPRRLEHFLGMSLPSASIAVVNAGVPGYSVAQMDDLVRDMMPRIMPQLVVEAVYADGFERLENPMTALDDIVVRTTEKRVVRRVEGGVVRSHMYRPALVSIDLWLQTHWYFGARLFEGAYDLASYVRDKIRAAPAATTHAALGDDATRGLAKGLMHLKHLNDMAHDNNVPMVVLMVSRFDEGPQINENDRAVAQEVQTFCKTAAIPFFDPASAVANSGLVDLWAKPGDYHWSAAVNDVVARAFATFLEDAEFVRAANSTDGL